jgi:hypothetical protein
VFKIVDQATAESIKDCKQILIEHFTDLEDAIDAPKEATRPWT